MDIDQASILIVEDEAALVSVLKPVLTAAGYAVAVATSLAEARDALAMPPAPDLILLDLGLPDGDGKTLVGTAVEQAAGVIIISARHQDEEKIASLDLGADDYVDKPFEIGVLMARIRAAIRRRHAGDRKPATYSHGVLHIDLAARQLTLGRDAVRLSPKEWALLAVLTASAGQVVTHKRLLLAGWGPSAGDTQYLRVYIGLLRQKIEADPSAPTILLTEPGIGYRLTAQTDSEGVRQCP